MIKKITLVVAALIFAFGVLGASVIKTSASTVSKNFKVSPVESSASGQMAREKALEKVDYFLAYPGILPDNFLYSLKMIRDRMMLFFTVDPLRKIDVLLLFADKRIGAAKALLDKGEKDLAVTTAAKAEKYLEQSINQERVARDGGRDTGAQQTRLLKATLKHEEILLEMQANIGESNSEMQKILEYPAKLREQLLLLKKN